MGFKNLFFLLVVSSLAASVPAFSQAERRFDPLRDDIASKIPPLSVLLDSAVAHNHYVQFRNLQIIVNECKLKAKQAEWTRNLGIQGNLGYGNLYNYSSNSESGIPTSNITTSRSESNYNGAVYLNMPVNTVADRKNQIKLAKTEIEQAREMAGEQSSETRQLTIKQYNDVILKQRLLRIRSKYMETARISMQMAEKEFSNGIVTVTEYTRISEIVTHSEADYETARIDFLTAYMVLEEIVGMKFHLSNP